MQNQGLRSAPPIRAGSLEEEAALSLRRAAERLDGAIAAVLARHELTALQYNVLRVLRSTGSAGIPAGEVAAHMGTRTPDATRLIDRLERQGRVRRERLDTDRRMVTVKITEVGRRTLAELDLPITAVHRRYLGHLGAQRLTELIQLLQPGR